MDGRGETIKRKRGEGGRGTYDGHAREQKQARTGRVFAFTLMIAMHSVKTFSQAH